MPKAGNSVYRKSLFRRNPYPNLLERAPLPDLVALHENGTLFSNPRVMTERAKEEEVARMANSTPRSKVNVTEPHPHPRASVIESQAEEDKDKLPNSQSGHCCYPHLPEDEHRTYSPTPSSPHPNIQHNHSPSASPNLSTQTKSMSHHSLRQRSRGLPDLRVITSPTRLAQLKNRNMSNIFRKLPLLESKQREQTQEPRFQNTIFEFQTQGNNYRNQGMEYHSHNNRNHHDPNPNPPRKQRKIRLRTGVPPHPRTRFSLGSKSSDPSQYITNPNSTPIPNRRTISPRPVSPSTLSPSLPQLLPRPLSNPLTSMQYVSAILSLRASTRNLQYFPLPPGIQLLEDFPQGNEKGKKGSTTREEQDIEFLALQMEQVEDAIRLEGAPAEAREVYYAQFARGEF
ncbi:hypothetical protein BCIN_12g04400 [Botrytis cinerea B05.10]|uniref:Uncharacterized protein n=1 Tax=Botryotinia fuckeliana (strain B05.10) TaxID=332648 RepID=A0A384JZ79_BOTFB|nr:hypothetical protein BCIN_12g04400 [Botrytis cinerea B05.10]ATZ55890.1 hypothetical protein BCIN_12g04400 [Botrytis cinerea B05.10]